MEPQHGNLELTSDYHDTVVDGAKLYPVFCTANIPSVIINYLISSSRPPIQALGGRAGLVIQNTTDSDKTFLGATREPVERLESPWRGRTVEEILSIFIGSSPGFNRHDHANWSSHIFVVLDVKTLSRPHSALVASDMSGSLETIRCDLPTTLRLAVCLNGLTMGIPYAKVKLVNDVGILTQELWKGYLSMPEATKDLVEIEIDEDGERWVELIDASGRRLGVVKKETDVTKENSVTLWRPKHEVVGGLRNLPESQRFTGTNENSVTMISDITLVSNAPRNDVIISKDGTIIKGAPIFERRLAAKLNGQDLVSPTKKQGATTPLKSAASALGELENDEKFTNFQNFSYDLQFKIWETAFPPRVVNLIYDQYNDRFHSFNSTTPTLLHIHKQTREMALATHQLCFGTSTHPARIYFNFNRDILLFDDYLQDPTVVIFGTNKWNKDVKIYSHYPIQEAEQRMIKRIAINTFMVDEEVKEAVRRYSYGSRGYPIDHYPLENPIKSLITQFASLRELILVKEHIVNPYYRGSIRLCDVDLSRPVCEPKCGVCQECEQSRAVLGHLKMTYGNAPKFRLMAGSRGFDKVVGLGCYYNDIDHDPDTGGIADTFYMNAEDLLRWDDEMDDNYDPLDNFWDDETDDEYGPLDDDSSSDAEDVVYHDDSSNDDPTDSEWTTDHESEISEGEIQDITNDEEIYLISCGRGHGEEYQDKQLEWNDPEYYEMRDML